MKTYEQFTDRNELEIAELIQQRRYQLLIHSCIYYHLNTNLISDKKWDEWAKELVFLQTNYPKISKKVTLYEYFKDWDASTGAFLPITEPWVVGVAESLIKLPKTVPKPVIKEHKAKTVKRKLF